MKNYLILPACLLLLTPMPSQAAPRDRTIDDAISMTKELGEIREKGVPASLLRDAHAVIIAPDMVKGGFVLAARFGHGALLIRDRDGGWSNPVFVTFTGASVGFQVGVQGTDLFLVVRDRRSLDRIMRDRGKITLGADASVAAGPVGRQASANTDAQLRAEILSYSRSRGIFAGVAIEGDTLQIDHRANEHFYNKRNVTVADIVTGKVGAPESARALRFELMHLQAEKEIGPKGPAKLELPIIP